MDPAATQDLIAVLAAVGGVVAAGGAAVLIARRAAASRRRQIESADGPRGRVEAPRRTVELDEADADAVGPAHGGALPLARAPPDGHPAPARAPRRPDPAVPEARRAGIGAAAAGQADRAGPGAGQEARRCGPGARSGQDPCRLGGPPRSDVHGPQGDRSRPGRGAGEGAADRGHRRAHQPEAARGHQAVAGQARAWQPRGHLERSCASAAGTSSASRRRR